jgi:uncharacterized membrane protein YjfL (UPF0719 family)
MKINDFVHAIMQLLIAIVNTISCTQVYEWCSMKFIILWQRYRFIDEALVDMQDEKIKQEVESQEKAMRIKYVLGTTLINLS